MLVAPASVNSVGFDQMATELQKAANRRNALMSTGPRSLAGKARSRMNAVSHGLTAQQTLLPGEDPAKYEGLRRSMFNSLRPFQSIPKSQIVATTLTPIPRPLPKSFNQSTIISITS
jgi:hypothetical protein